MEIGQETLNQVISNQYGTERKFQPPEGDAIPLTFRVVLVESIYKPDAERGGSEKLRSYELAKRIGIDNGGSLALNPEEIKTILERAEGWPDDVYGQLCGILDGENGKVVPESKQDKDVFGHFGIPDDTK